MTYQRYYAYQAGAPTGRFLSPDPGGISTADLRNPVSLNRYAYAYGDPANLIDPSGEKAIGIPPNGPITDCWSDREGKTVDCIFYPKGGWTYILPAPPKAPTGPPVGVSQQGQYDMSVEKAELMIVQGRIASLGDCTKVLGGASAADLSKVANSITFLDGRAGSIGSDRTEDSIAGNGDQTTLAASVSGSIAVTLTNNGTILPYVVLGSDMYNDPSVDPANTLLHEVLHVALNLGGPGDQDLKAYLSQYGFTSGFGGTGGTDDITQWLKANCPGGRQ